MSRDGGTEHNRPYSGTITGSDEYSKQNTNASDFDKIPFNSWLPGSEWLYCDQRKYVGHGYALFTKRKWKKYFHLSEKPLHTASMRALSP